MNKKYEKLYSRMEKIGSKARESDIPFNQARVKELMFERMDQAAKQSIISKFRNWQHFRLVPIGIAVFLFIVVGLGTAYASDDAVPGDALYAVDRAIESARYNLIRDPQEQTEFRLRQAEERAAEFEHIRDLKEQFDSVRGNESLSLDEANSAVTEALDTIEKLKEESGGEIPQRIDHFEQRLQNIQERLQQRMDRDGGDTKVRVPERIRLHESDTQETEQVPIRQFLQQQPQSSIDTLESEFREKFHQMVMPEASAEEIDEMTTREMYDQLSPEQQEAVKRTLRERQSQ